MRGWKEGGVGGNFHCADFATLSFFFCQYLWWSDTSDRDINLACSWVSDIN